MGHVYIDMPPRYMQEAEMATKHAVGAKSYTCPLCHRTLVSEEHMEDCLCNPASTNESSWRLAYVFCGHVYITSVYDVNIWLKAKLPTLTIHNGRGRRNTVLLGRYMSTDTVHENWQLLTGMLTEGDWLATRPHPVQKRFEYGDLTLCEGEDTSTFHGGYDPFRPPLPDAIKVQPFPRRNAYGQPW